MLALLVISYLLCGSAYLLWSIAVAQYRKSSGYVVRYNKRAAQLRESGQHHIEDIK